MYRTWLPRCIAFFFFCVFLLVLHTGCSDEPDLPELRICYQNHEYLLPHSSISWYDGKHGIQADSAHPLETKLEPIAQWKQGETVKLSFSEEPETVLVLLYEKKNDGDYTEQQIEVMNGEWIPPKEGIYQIGGSWNDGTITWVFQLEEASQS